MGHLASMEITSEQFYGILLLMSWGHLLLGNDRVYIASNNRLRSLSPLCLSLMLFGKIDHFNANINFRLLLK